MPKPKYPIAVMASGSGSTAEALIRHTQTDPELSELSVELVVTNNPKAGVLGRVARLNEEFGLAIEAHHISAKTHPGTIAGPGELSDNESTALSELFVDRGVALVMLLGYLKKISGPLLDEWGQPPNQESPYYAHMLNTHPGILPETKGYWGEGVHRHVIETGLARTAHTMHVVAAGYDEGKIVAEHFIDVEPGMTPEQLAARVQEVEKQKVPEVILQFLRAQEQFLADKLVI